MAVRIKDTTKAELCSIQVPVFADGYIIRTHEEIMNGIEAQLVKYGYTIKESIIKSTADGKLAHGVYYLEDDEDSEIGRMLTWVNCYTKQFKYRTTAGVYLKSNKAIMSFSADKYLRKYSGLLDEIKHLNTLFTSALEYKTELQNIEFNITDQSHVLGSLFVQHDVLTTEQASALKTTLGDTQTMWQVYSNVAEVLMKSHCKDWIRNQSLVNYYFRNTLEEFQFSAAPIIIEEEALIEVRDPLAVIPNQTNIIDQIAEIEAQDTQTYDEAIHEIAERMKENDPETYDALSKIEQDFQHQLVFGRSEVETSDETEVLDLPEDVEIVERQVEVVEATENTFEYEIETIHYTDPAGNTFEAPMVGSEFDLDVFSPEPSLEPSPEEHAVFEQEVASEMAINDDFEFDFSEEEEEEDTTDDFIL